MFKIIPFIEYDDRQEFFDNIEEYFSLSKKDYQNFVAYF